MVAPLPSFLVLLALCVDLVFFWNDTGCWFTLCRPFLFGFHHLLFRWSILIRFPGIGNRFVRVAKIVNDSMSGYKSWEF